MMMTFSKFVKKTIEDRHLSARRVARAAGIDPSFFSKILSGKRSPPSDEKILKRLAKALGADPVYMVFLAGRIPDEFREMFLNESFISSLRRAAGSQSVPSASKQPERSQRPIASPRPETPPPGDEVMPSLIDMPAPPRLHQKAHEDISEDLL
ncbi:MAG: helix-turn-helix domain-containing protein [Endomicrobiia bacterium]|nr:helix-turn-helix domain-containing protein [Endomicrobiia bacterium]